MFFIPSSINSIKYLLSFSLSGTTIPEVVKKILCLIYNKERAENLKKRRREKMGGWRLNKEEFERCKKEAVEKTVV